MKLLRSSEITKKKTKKLQKKVRRLKSKKYLRMKGVITGKVVEWENGEKMQKLSEVGFSKIALCLKI